MTTLIDAAKSAVALLAKQELTPEDLEQARALLNTAVEAEQDPKLTWLAEASRVALVAMEQEQALFPGFVEEGGKRVAYARDTSRWVFGLPDTPGAYWFVLPYMEKYKSSGLFRGEYFGDVADAKLDGRGRVPNAELAQAWHQPLFQPEIPESITCRETARSKLDGALEGPEMGRYQQGA